MHVDDLELFVQFVRSEIGTDMFAELLNFCQTRHEDEDGRFVFLFFVLFSHLFEHHTHTIVKLLVGAGVLLAENDRAPSLYVLFLAKEAIKCIKIQILSFVSARFSDVDGRTGVPRIHES